MIRIEIIANHSVEENILEAFKEEGVGAFYTRFPGVYGFGSCGPRMGDAIWPEENFVIVVWCEKEEAVGIERAIASVKEHFPDEGIKAFKLTDAPQMVYLPVQTAASPVAAPLAEPAVPATSRKKTAYYGPEGENI